MSWLTRVRNSISFLPKRQTTDTLWHKCKNCDAMVFTKEWEDNLQVCPRCDHHDRIRAGPDAGRADADMLDGAGHRGDGDHVAAPERPVAQQDCGAEQVGDRVLRREGQRQTPKTQAGSTPW